MNVDGSGTKRLTSEKGYDGGPFFSWDGQTIVYRAYHPKTKDELKEYESLLKQNLIKPTRAEIFMMSAEGTNKRQITNNDSANWAPLLVHNNMQIIFPSMLQDPQRTSFHVHILTVDGTRL